MIVITKNKSENFENIAGNVEFLDQTYQFVIRRTNIFNTDLPHFFLLSGIRQRTCGVIKY